MVYETRYSDSLTHYGIKGQKWGVRRFQRKDGTRTPAGKKRYSGDSETDSNVDSSEKKRGLTDKQKKILKTGVIVAGTALAAYGAYRLYGAYTGRGMDIDPETGFRLLKKPESTKDCLNAINPGKVRILSSTKNTEIISGSSTNCMLCTTAYELRRRGYDVHAGFDTSGRGYFPENLFPRIFKNAPETTKIWQAVDDIANGKDYSAADKFSRLTDSLKDVPDGARGNLCVWFKSGMGGGHSMIWEKTDGKLRFMDGQTGEIYNDLANQVLKHTHDLKPIEVLRTDNLEIKPQAIRPFVNTATTTKTYIDHGAEIATKALSDPAISGIAFNTAIIAAGAYYAKKHPESSATKVTTVKTDTKTKKRRA